MLAANERRHVPLAPYTTLGIGGEADWFFAPGNVRELVAALQTAHGLCAEVRILGGGSNLLIADEGVRGAVISMRHFEPRHIERDGTRVRVSAGVKLPRLVNQCAAWGLSGLEALAGIPGTTGGAISMNAGGAQGCIGDRVVALELMSPKGELSRVPAAAIEWGYRRVGIGRALVTFAELELGLSTDTRVAARMWDNLERKRAAQPLSVPSAGCFFKNPEGMSAGRLLDLAGLKGMRVGGAVVSRKHANFLVNRGGATSHDMLTLVAQLRTVVRARFNVDLQPEVCCW